MAKILVGVTGGVAIYKSLELIRLYQKHGHDVCVMMSSYAEKFITPMTFEAISKNKVLTYNNEVSSISHISLASWADICVIAPATANTIAKINVGIADSPMLSTILALKAPLLLAPSMNTFMYQNIITQRNMSELKKIGVAFVEPTDGELACGEVGIGRLADIRDIFDATMKILNRDKSSLSEGCTSKSSGVLAGKKVLVTGGGTVETIDPVRYIGNHSSGKMGLALALASSELGADVTFIVGKVDSSVVFPNMLRVSSAQDMFDEVKRVISDNDILIMSAAVADYRIESIFNEKIKKGDSLDLKLVKNIDILSELAKDKRANQIFVGFAAESNDIEKNAIDKLNRKKIDMIVANDIKRSDIGFNSDMNEVTIYSKAGGKKQSKIMNKYNIAKFILAEVATAVKQL